MTKKQFKVGDKVRILDVTGIWLAKEQGYKSGDIAEVIRVNSQGRPLIPAKGGGRLIIGRDELQYIEKVAEDVAKFNVGDKVKAVTNDYGMTTKSAGWEGVVTEVNGEKFSAETTQGKYSTKGRVYPRLRVADFEKIVEHAQVKQTQKFAVGDKVRIISTEGQPLLGFEDGDVVTITDANKNGSGVQRYEVRRSDGAIGFGGNNTFELVADKPQKPSKKQRLTDAEKRIAALEAEVATLKAAQSKPTIKIDLSPNARRAAIIAEAKAFIITKLHYLQDSSKCDGGIEAKRRENPKFSSWLTKVEFVVNAEKRTVVAIIRNMFGDKIRAKEIAKCAPDDVFNADIGKAIALGRALGLDVKRFEQAVKPMEVIAGMVVENTGSAGGTYKIVKVDGDQLDIDNRGRYFERHYGVIKDDTEAQYGV